MSSLWRAVLFCLLSLATPAVAGDGLAGDGPAKDGIAMYGQPKYAADFTQFDYVNAAAPKGGTLKIASTGTFDTLNPFNIKGTVPPDSVYNKLVFESLLYRSADEPFTMYPLLAQSVELPDDRSSITFHLNPAAKWADGVAVTADDVLFSVGALKASGRPTMRSYYSRIAKLERLDARSVRFTFARNPDGQIDRELPLIVSLMPVLPKHYWSGKDVGASTLVPPLGSGPYQVTAVDPGRSLTLARNDSYWGHDLSVNRGMNNFAKIIVNFYRDETVARTAVLAGEADFKTEGNLLTMQRSYRGRSIDSGAVVTEALVHHRPEPYRGLVLNTRHAPLDDPDLRAALETASDFPQLNRTLYGGQLKRSLSSFANSELAARGPEDATVAPAIFRARVKTAIDKLLAKGYRYEAQQLVAPDGKPLNFEILLADAADEKLALGWLRQLAQVGITARVRTVDAAQFAARLNDFDYDIVVYRFINSLSPGNEQALYWGRAAADVPGSRNYAGVHDAAIDSAIDNLRHATDYAGLTVATRALDQKLIDGHYVIPFFYTGADLIAHSAHMKHPERLPLTGYDLRTFWWQ